MTIAMLKKQFGTLINGSEIGFPFSKIVEVIMAYKTEGVAILGGDIYLKVGDSFTPKYDNWYCNGCDCNKSVNRALDYINKYPFHENIYVVLVPN